HEARERAPPGGFRRAHRLPPRRGTRAARQLPRPDPPGRSPHRFPPLPRRSPPDPPDGLGGQPPGIRPPARRPPLPGLQPGRPEHRSRGGRRLRGPATRRRTRRTAAVWATGPDAHRAPPADPRLPRLPQGHGPRPGPARNLARGPRPGARPTHLAVAPRRRSSAEPSHRAAGDHPPGAPRRLGPTAGPAGDLPPVGADPDPEGPEKGTQLVV